MTGERLDLSSDSNPSGEPAGRNRAYVGVHFACCSVYTRVYVNREETAYEGACPRCGKRVRLTIGPGGTDSRFFTAH